MNVDPGIHEEVIQELKLLGSSQELGNEKSNAVLFQADLEKKNRVFESCLVLLDDVARRRSAVVFLLFYLPAFPCTTSRLHSLHKRVLDLLDSPSIEYQHLLQFLCRTVEQLLAPLESAATTKRIPDPFSMFDSGFLQKDTENTDTTVPVLLRSDSDAMLTAQYRNQHFAFHRKEIPSFLLRRSASRYSGMPRGHNTGSGRVEDYIYQCPLIYKKEEVKQHLKVLSQFWDRYRSNPNVVRASSFLIKIICDSYVSKLPLGQPYCFRSVTICVLPMLLEWIEGDYLCIRHHVFDFLITLGAHLQLVDSQSIYPGVSKELEKELSWLLQQVLQQQILVVPYDELTWTAAAKSILAILPRPERSTLDPRLLLQILNISSLAELHPDMFGTFCEAFAQSLLRPPGLKRGRERKGNKREGTKKMVITLPNIINKREFSKLGTKGFTNILSLYSRSYTVGGRLWLFKLIFAFAAQRLQEIEEVRDQSEWEAALQISLKNFVRYGFFWAWHAQLFYTNPRIRAEVTSVFSIPTGSGYKPFSSYTRSVYSKLLDILLSVAEENTALPESLIRQFAKHHTTSDVISEAGLTKAVEDVLQTARVLLRSTDSCINYDLYNTAWRLLLYILDIIRSLGEEGDVLLQRFIHAIIVCPQDDFTDGNLIRRVVPDLLASEFIRWNFVSHGNPSNNPLEKSIKKVWSSILEAYLNNEACPATYRVAALYYNVVEVLTEFQCSPYYASSCECTDLTGLLLDRFAIIETDSLEKLGVHFFWPLYKILASETAVSVCRTRHVLTSFLYFLTKKSPSFGHMWKCILDDAYPPVSLIAATRVQQISIQLKNPLFEKDEDLKGIWQSLYTYAQSLVPSKIISLGA